MFSLFTRRDAPTPSQAPENIVTLPRDPVTSNAPKSVAGIQKDEAETINNLIRKGSESGGELKKALRERRLSGESFSKKAMDEVVHRAATGHWVSGGEVKEINERIRSTQPRERRISGPTSTSAKQLWEAAATAVKVDHKLGTLSTLGSTDKERPLLATKTSEQNLSGAAARGAKQAALGRVREAAAAVGGVFLTTEQREALRDENNGLRVTNKRLEEQLAAANAEIRELKQQLKDGAGSPSLISRMTFKSPVARRSVRHRGDESQNSASPQVVARPPPLTSDYVPRALEA